MGSTMGPCLSWKPGKKVAYLSDTGSAQRDFVLTRMTLIFVGVY